MEINYEEAGRILLSLDNVLICAHFNPDGDAVGSVLALYYALKKAGKRVCYHIENIPKTMEYLLDSENSEFDADNLIITDVGDIKLLDEAMKNAGKQCILNIDHHATNLRFAENTLIKPECAAACEVIYNLFTAVGIEIDDKIANCLYLGITTDTGCFRFSNTTADTMFVAGNLLRFKVNNGEINRIQFDTKSRKLIEFERMAMNTLATYFDDKCAVISLTTEMFEKCDVGENDIHGVTNMPRMLEGVLCGVVIKQRDKDTFKISVRTNPPVCASDICAELGGGGHKAAAGAEYKGTLEQATEKVLSVVKKYL